MTRTRTRRGVGLVVAVVLGAALLDAAAQADQGEGRPAVPVTAAAQARIAAGGLHSCAVLADRTAQCWGSNDQGQLGNGTVVTSTAPVPVTDLTGVTALTAGNTHTCAIVDDGTGNGTGTVRCWGLSANGQVGDGTVGDKQSDRAQPPIRRKPVTVVRDAQGTALTGVVAISAGGFHTCAVTKDVATAATQAWCWGDDGAGQLGDGRPGDRTSTAQPVPGLTGVRALALGEFHSCALLLDGTVRCWGANSFGQLTLDPATTQSSPVPVTVAGLPAPSSTDPQVLAITTGYGHVCVLLADTTARCWGQNGSGQLGYRTDYVDPAAEEHQKITPKKPMKPSAVPGAVRRNTYTASLGGAPDGELLVDQDGIVALTAGEFHTCAVLGDGTARCWGQGGRGQLGTDPYADSAHRGQIEDSAYAVQVGGLPAASAITAGGFHTCAAADAAIMCWGYDFYGQLGSRASESPVPVQVTAVTGATQVSAGTGFACALVNADTPGKPVCWGDNTDGRLGAGVATAKSSVRVAVSGIASASALDAGNGHACALPLGSATPKCWGLNQNGQLGDATTSSKSTPVPVSGLATATSVSAGGARGSDERGHSCSVTSTGTVSCWGRNGNGQLGVEEPDGTLADHSTPVTVRYDSDPEPGDDHVLLADLAGISSVVTGGRHTCALAAADATVWCWGLNASGQLGDSSTTERHHAVHVQKDGSDPTRDNPLTGVAALSAGAEHTCAVLTTGAVTCWGNGDDGRLGSGIAVSSSTPVDVVGLDGADDSRRATALTAGDLHTCAVLADGAMTCWGDDSSGQLGNGAASDDSLTPTGVVNMEKTHSSVPTSLRPVIRSISASRDNTCAVLLDTTVYCWGSNAHDQLGDGIGATSVTPRKVGLASPF